MSAPDQQDIILQIEAFSSRNSGTITQNKSDTDISCLGSTTPATVTIPASVVEVSSDMDTLDIVTVLLAVLGVVVLILCVIVAGLLIYHYCRYRIIIREYCQDHSPKSIKSMSDFDHLMSPCKNLLI